MNVSRSMPQRPRLRTSHRLASGVYFLALPRTSGTMVDVVRRIPATGSLPLRGVGPYGPMVTVAEQTQVFPRAGVPYADGLTSGLTLFGIARSGQYDGRVVTTSGGLNGCSMIVGAEQNGFYLNKYGASNVQSGLTITRNWAFYAVTRIGPAKPMRFWTFDLVTRKYQTVSLTEDFAGSVAGDGNASVGGYNLPFDVALAGFATRVWTDADFAAFVADPFGMVRPQPIPLEIGLVTSAAQTLILPAIAATSAAYAPAVAPGAVVLVLPSLGPTSAAYAPTVAPGPVTLATPLIGPTGAAFPPALAATGQLAIPFIGPTSQAFPPALDVAASTLVLPTIVSTSAAYAPTIQRGAVVLTLPAIASAAAAYPPTLVAGGLSLTLPTIASGAAAFPPALVYGQVLTLPAIPATSAAFPPALYQGAIHHGPTRFASTSFRQGPDPSHSTILES